MIPIPRLKPDGAAILNTALAATGVPGTLAVANAEGILFSGTTGPFDPLKPDSRALKEDDLMWFASTTKLLTSICEYPSPQLSWGPAFFLLWADAHSPPRLPPASGQGVAHA